jgi:putative membrane protein
MFLDKFISLIIGVLFLFAISCDGPTSNEAGDKNFTTSKAKKPLLQDPVFWDYAASSNMLQVELGKLALENASSEQMKSRGGNISDFHSKALSQIKSLVSEQPDIKLPDSLGTADRKLIDELRELKGEEFNTRYRDFILNTHKLQLERYQEALGRAENQKVKDWLQAMLIHLKDEFEIVSSPDSLN